MTTTPHIELTHWLDARRTGTLARRLWGAWAGMSAPRELNEADWHEHLAALVEGAGLAGAGPPDEKPAPGAGRGSARGCVQIGAGETRGFICGRGGRS